MSTPTAHAGEGQDGDVVRRRKAGSNVRILVLAHLGFGAVVWYIIGQGLELLWAQMGWPRSNVLGIAPPWTVAGVASGAVAIGIVAFNSKVQTFSNEVINELRKVTWPSMKETRQTTLVVMVATGLIAAILGAWDFVFSNIIKRLLTGA